MAEIGEKLQEARKAKGYTLDDLQQMTKIQKRYLIAIEEGNYSVMPGKFYARAFIKQYADTVGLNGDHLLEEYDDAVPHTHDEEFVEKVSSGQTRSGSKKQDSFLENIQDYLPTILMVVIVLAIVFAVYFAVTQSAGSNEENLISVDSSNSMETSANEKASQQAEESTESESESESTAPESAIEVVSSSGTSTTYSISNPGDSNTVSLKAEGGDSWVSIEADNEMLEQGLITDGNALEAEIPAGSKSVVMIIGSAPNTSIQFNDQMIDYAPEASANVRQEIELQFEESAPKSE